MSLARLLAHNETSQSSAATLVPVDFCQELARGLRAEKLTRRLYRLLPPESIFAHAGDFPEFKPGEIVEKLNLASRVELPGLRFVPADPVRQRAMRRADAIAVLQEYRWA